MEVRFESERLRELCQQQRVAERRLGTVCARKLQARLVELRTATAVAELASGRPHPLAGDRAGEFALDLEGGRRLVFVPDDDPVPSRDDGSIDWSQVTIIRIVFIGDYHD
jgi:proteic killer suppression protein